MHFDWSCNIGILSENRNFIQGPSTHLSSSTIAMMFPRSQTGPGRHSLVGMRCKCCPAELSTKSVIPCLYDTRQREGARQWTLSSPAHVSKLVTTPLICNNVRDQQATELGTFCRTLQSTRPCLANDRSHSHAIHRNHSRYLLPWLRATRLKR
jgi:hypothetical protein